MIKCSYQTATLPHETTLKVSIRAYSEKCIGGIVYFDYFLYCALGWAIGEAPLRRIVIFGGGLSKAIVSAPCPAPRQINALSGTEPRGESMPPCGAALR